MRRAPPDRRQLARRRSLRLLLPAGQTHPRHVRLRTPRCAPGRVEGQPSCRQCSGVRLNVDCRSCGAEEELYGDGRCWPYVLATTVDRLLTNPTTGEIARELAPMAQALKSMKAGQ